MGFRGYGMGVGGEGRVSHRAMISEGGKGEG